MYIDPQWLKYLSRFREHVKGRYKYKPLWDKQKITSEMYNELLSDRNRALDYITMLCNDMENLIIENNDLIKKVKMMEENLIDD